MITQARLKELFRYDRKTGQFVRKIRISNQWPGTVAGVVDAKDGYVRIRIEGKSYLAHRLAWLYVRGRWPDPECEHEDRNRSNNCWNNLREASRTQNCWNRKQRSDSHFKYKGVFRGKNATRFCARIFLKGKWKSLGSFDTQEAAAERYKEEAARHFGEFACFDGKNKK